MAQSLTRSNMVQKRFLELKIDPTDGTNDPDLLKVMQMSMQEVRKYFYSVDVHNDARSVAGSNHSPVQNARRKHQDLEIRQELHRPGFVLLRLCKPFRACQVQAVDQLPQKRFE